MNRSRLFLMALAVPGCAEPQASAPGILVRNAEFGLSTEFPGKLKVCTALSGEHPVGFYAWLNRTTDCDSPKPKSVASISVTASYNAAFKTTPSLSACADGTAPGLSGVDLSNLTFPGHRSVRCAVGKSDGSIEVFVATQAGKQVGQALPPDIAAAPAMDYGAWLRTRPDRLREDMATLRAILRRTTIQPPERTLPD